MISSISPSLPAPCSTGGTSLARDRTLHGHFPVWARIVYLLAMMPPNMIAGVMIALSPEVALHVL